MNYRLLQISGVVAAALYLVATPALAHVVVKPNEVGVATFQTFTMGVPNEKDVPTVALRLVIPADLKFVSPTVKPGWRIEIKKEGSGEEAKVTEINWVAGSIPAGMRDDFTFSAQVPAQETTLQWKAYQTYQNGTVVAWDQAPSDHHGDDDAAPTGPYSETKIVNDLVSPQGAVATPTPAADRKPLVFSIAALALSAVAIGLAFRK